METWLEEKSFEMYNGMWFGVMDKNNTTLVVLKEEDGSFSAALGKGTLINASFKEARTQENTVFLSLPEDQAKENIIQLCKAAWSRMR